MVLLEAMAVGCPIISTNVGGISEVIKNNENGLLIQPENSEAIADTILKLLENEELKSRFRNKGIELVSEKFLAQKMVKSYQKLYTEKNYKYGKKKDENKDCF
jgi:glycosyltransferase involved in cell wall biosynthesis